MKPNDRNKNLKKFSVHCIFFLPVFVFKFKLGLDGKELI